MNPVSFGNGFIDTTIASFYVARNRVEEVDHVALYLRMEEDVVTHEKIIAAVDCVEGAKQLLRIVDGLDTEISAFEIAHWAEITVGNGRPWTENSVGDARPWVGLLRRAIEYWEFFLPAETELQECLMVALEQQGVEGVREKQREAECSAWKSLIEQLSRELPTKTDIDQRRGSLKTIPSVTELFGPQTLEIALKVPMNGNNTKAMHLPATVMSMLWVHSDSPLWLASVPVTAEIVKRFLQSYDYQFDWRSSQDFEKGFVRVCQKQIKDSGLLRGFPSKPPISGIKKKDLYAGFEGFQFRGSFDVSLLPPTRMVAPPKFNDGRRAVCIDEALNESTSTMKSLTEEKTVLEKIPKGRDLTENQKERIGTINKKLAELMRTNIQVIREHPKYDSMKCERSDPELSASDS